MSEPIPKTKCPRCNGCGRTTDIPALRERRKASGLKLWQVAISTGHSVTHVSGAERGKHPALEPFASSYVACLLDAESQPKTKPTKKPTK